MMKSEKEYLDALHHAIDAHCRGEYVPVDVAILCPAYAHKLDDRLTAIYITLAKLEELIAKV